MRSEDAARVQRGQPAPLGATVHPNGTNFAVFSKYAARVELLLFERPDAPYPSRTIVLDTDLHRTNYYWHVHVPGVGDGQVYAWRVHGPDRPAAGHRFDGQKVLLDPYGLAVTGLDLYDRQAACDRGDNCPRALRSVVIDTAQYDWQDDTPLPPRPGREVIYEMHLSGFTKDPSSGLAPELRGTYAGLIAKIPYLVDLGVTTVELLPVHQYDPQDAPRGMRNVWGYSTVSYFAPHAEYAADRSPTGCVREFRDMVKALHAAGLKVVLDVVYNHTAEGGADGPTLCWRGFENSAYYILQKDKARYADFTGCGNTVNANHSIVRRMITDSLTYWVREMHVDGFRFDLASVLSRGEDGEPLANPPILWAIESDPELAGTRLIAEAWDAAGLHQVGDFTGDRFAEWNDGFRDTVRRFLRGDDGTIEDLMARIVGSPDLFRSPNDRPSHSINFVTCHDGFCLADLVAYAKKHNQANGEDNRDGSDNNLSWNCGVEGDTDDVEILTLRARQVRNFLCLLLLSHGQPMLWMGDEVGDSRGGNNNPWCQDNALNWLDWNLVHEDNDLLRFTRRLLAFTGNLRILDEDRFWRATNPQETGDISWHGTELEKPDWTAASHSLAYTYLHSSGAERVHVILNADTDADDFSLPFLPRGFHWLSLIDTADADGRYIVPVEQAQPVTAETVTAAAHSVRVLLAVEE